MPHSPAGRDLIDNLTRRLDAQAKEIDALRTDLDIQFQRIAHMQAELDMLPTAERRREKLRARLDGGRAEKANGSNGSARNTSK